MKYAWLTLITFVLLALVSFSAPTYAEGSVKPDCIAAADFDCGETPEPSTTLVPTAPPPPDETTAIYMPFIVANNCGCNSFTDVGMND